MLNEMQLSCFPWICCSSSSAAHGTFTLFKGGLCSSFLQEHCVPLEYSEENLKPNQPKPQPREEGLRLSALLIAWQLDR